MTIILTYLGCVGLGRYAGLLGVKDSDTVKIEVVDTSLPGSILGYPIKISDS